MSLEAPRQKICVATCTRRRAEFLKNVLAKWSRLHIPDNVDVHFAVIENDSDPRSRDLVESARSAFGQDRLAYLLETLHGIAQARNAAIRHACSIGADYLLLADDDVMVDVGWLAAMLACARENGAWIVACPVSVKPRDEPKSLPARIVLADVRRNYERKAHKYARLAASGEIDRINFATTSWLGDCRLFTDLGLRFDESMGVFGGEDVKFGMEARKHGVRFAWCEETTVVEIVPPERLSLRYRYKRAAAQAANMCYLDTPSPGIGDKLKYLAYIAPLRAASGIGLTLLAPFTRGRSAVAAARKFGAAKGAALFAVGKRIDLYR